MQYPHSSLFNYKTGGIMKGNTPRTSCFYIHQLAFTLQTPLAALNKENNVTNQTADIKRISE